jgi:hypothetical protein
MGSRYYGNHKLRGINKKTNQSDKNKIYMYPLLFVFTILPFIIYMKEYNTPLSDFEWFSLSSDYIDFFLFYKSFLFLVIVFVMFIINMYNFSEFKKSINQVIFIPLVIYAFLALLSSVISPYRKISFLGSYEHFESIFVLLGYCLLVLYSYHYVKSENDVKFIMKCILFTALVMSAIGFTQAIGHDFFSTDIGKKLITPREFWPNISSLSFNFNDWVYLVQYNPNYVGGLVVLLTPLLIILALFNQNLKSRLLYAVAVIGLLISMVFSKSITGVIGFVIASMLFVMLFWRYIKKYALIVTPIIVVLLIGGLIVNGIKGNIIGTKINQILNLEKTEYNLTDIQTKDDELVINYIGNELHIAFTLDENGVGDFLFTDQTAEIVHAEVVQENGHTYYIMDSRFPDFVITPCMYNEVLSFKVQIDGTEWFFTNQTDGTYYYINAYARYDKIVTAETAVFTGYESIATDRGYLWSRTIPLLKNYILLGSGADTFAIAFPQRDYVSAYNAGFNDRFITKPHNMYLQMAVQTGVLSMIAFLVFYGIYFVSSMRLYIHGRFNSFYAQVGVGVFIGTFGYMITGIANDSTITVAPMFWALMGLGIAINYKVKPLIMEEVSKAKAAQRLTLDK